MKKILVVDDDAGILEMVQLVLEGAGYEVQTSLNGACFQQMHSERPDLILLDILLSGEDGRELCRQVKSREQTRHIPVILFSAHFSAKDIVARSGADAFLPKPFHLHELINLVKRYL
ncbi:MAG: response regulator [Chloroflexi bacterium]|nr:response regulator [Chloroflexota bacterium]